MPGTPRNQALLATLAFGEEEGVHYYFDILDDEGWSHDEVGVDCRDEQHARQLAAMALTEMARQQILPNGDVTALRISVRLGEVSLFTLVLKFDTISGWTTHEI